MSMKRPVIFLSILLFIFICSFFRFFVVVSGSMIPAIPLKSVVVVQTKGYKVDTGDIITYKTEDGEIITHRLIDIEGDGYITKGDRNDTPDLQKVSPANVIGKVVLCIPAIGILILHKELIFLGIVLIVILVMLKSVNKRGGKHETKT